MRLALGSCLSAILILSGLSDPLPARNVRPRHAAQDDQFSGCWGHVWSVEVWSRRMPGGGDYAQLVLDAQKCEPVWPKYPLFVSLGPVDPQSTLLVSQLIAARASCGATSVTPGPESRRCENVYVVFEVDPTGPWQRIVRVDLPGSAVTGAPIANSLRGTKTPYYQGTELGRPIVK